MTQTLPPLNEPPIKAPAERLKPVPPSPQPPKKRRALRILIGLMVLGALGFVFTGLAVPRIVAWQMQKFTGRMFRFGFLVITPDGRVAVSARGGQLLNKDFHLNAAKARLDWWNILFRRIRVGYIDLADARIDIEKNKAGEFIVNGVNTSQLGSKPGTSADLPTPAASGSPSKPWGVGVGQVTFKNLEFNYRSAELNSKLIVNQLTIGSAESWHSESETPIEADLELNGGRILIKGTYTPFSSAPRIRAAVTITEFPLEPLAVIIGKSGIEQLTGQISLNGQIDSRYDTKHGLFNGKWDATVNFVNVTGLNQKPSATKEGFGKKIRFKINGPINIQGMQMQMSGTKTLVEINELKNSGVLRMELHDETFHRPPVFMLNPVDVQIKNISTFHPERPLSFDFKAALGKYDRFSAAGEVTPFAKKLNGKFTAKIKEVDLTPFTGYSERYTGSRIQTGVLNIDSEGVIKDDQIEATNKVVLKKLEFQYINREKEDERTAKIGIPSNVVLALIKDKNGNIDLNVPVTGSVRDPNVGFGSLMMKITAYAIGIAAQKAAEAFFPPLKTISLIVSGVQFATKWRFEPLVFEAGTLTMTKETQDYLSAVGKKLQDRPKVQLTVCGFGTRMDLSPGKKSKKPENDSKKEPDPLTQVERDLLIKLALDRAGIVKDFLVNDYAIDSGRLLMCTPDVDESKSAFPRANLSL